MRRNGNQSGLVGSVGNANVQRLASLDALDEVRCQVEAYSKHARCCEEWLFEGEGAVDDVDGREHCQHNSEDHCEEIDRTALHAVVVL